MAIVVGDEVALLRNPVTATLGVRGNVLFGIVIDASSGNDVVWENGQSSEAIPSAQLDKILPTSPDVGARVVYFNDADGGGEQSPEYRCAVARGYTRQPAGAGDSAEFVLMRSLSSGVSYEAPVAAVLAVDGV